MPVPRVTFQNYGLPRKMGSEGAPSGAPGQPLMRLNNAADITMSSAIRDWILTQPRWVHAEGPREAVKVVLQSCATHEEFEYLSVAHYATHPKTELNGLLRTVFGDGGESASARAALREINGAVFGCNVHPSFASPRLERRTVSHFSTAPVPAPGIGLPLPGLAGAEGEGAAPPAAPPDLHSAGGECKPKGGGGDGNLSVKHPPELLRRPSVDAITVLPANIAEALGPFRTVSTFHTRQPNWVHLLDLVFMWLLYVQGSLSFERELTNKVHRLLESGSVTLNIPRLTKALSPGGAYSLDKFVAQLGYRRHPQKPERTKATLDRLGAQPINPYTQPLIEARILTGSGVTQSLEESSLKEGDSGFDQLHPDATGRKLSFASFAAAAPAPVTGSANGSGGSSSAAVPEPADASSHPVPAASAASTPSSLPAGQPSGGPCNRPGGLPLALAVPIGPGHGPVATWTSAGANCNPFGIASTRSIDQLVTLANAASSLEQRHAGVGSGGGSNGNAASSAGGPDAGVGSGGGGNGRGGNGRGASGRGASVRGGSVRGGQGPRGGRRAHQGGVQGDGAAGDGAAGDGSGQGGPTKKSKPSPQPAPEPEPAPIPRAPKLSQSERSTVEGLLLSKTLPCLRLVQDAADVSVRDLLTVTSPFFVAGLFQDGSKYYYYVGKPLAVHKDILYTAFMTSKEGSFKVEANGLYGHPGDAGVGPNALLTAAPDPGAYAPPQEASLAADDDNLQAAISQLTSEGKLSTEAKSLLVKRVAIITKAIINDASVDKVTNGRMFTSLSKLSLNDPEVLETLALRGGQC